MSLLEDILRNIVDRSVGRCVKCGTLYPVADLEPCAECNSVRPERVKYAPLWEPWRHRFCFRCAIPTSDRDLSCCSTECAVEFERRLNEPLDMAFAVELCGSEA